MDNVGQGGWGGGVKTTLAGRHEGMCAREFGLYTKGLLPPKYSRLQPINFTMLSSQK